MAGRSILFLNGNFITLWPERPRARALLVRDSRIVAAGGIGEVLARARREDGRPEVVDLEGRTVLPGLIDSHLHLLALGLSLGGVDLAGAASVAEAMARVEAHARDLPPDAWVVGRGWDQDRFAERRYPDRHDLDRAGGDRPCLILRVCGHVAAASSRVLEQAGVTAATLDPEGGRIDRHPGTGEPTGILRETAIRAVGALVPPPGDAERRLALERAARRALAEGVTSVRVDDVPAAGGLAGACRLYRETVGPDGLPLRVILDVSDWALDELLADASPGDEWFRLGGVKIFADGSLGARTAALSEPYNDAPDNWGITITVGEELDGLVARAHRAGRQVAIHAIGDRAAAYALGAIERARRADPRPDPRHRLVHCQVLTPYLVRRMAEAGVVAEIQPAFVASDQRWAEDRLGPERLGHAYAWRTLLAAGIPLAGGSDAPVEPVNPFYGIHAAVTRQDREGRPPGGWQPHEKLTVEEALTLFTRGGAYASFDEGRKGSLEPGKLADLVVIPADPTRIEPAALKDLRPVMTVVGGRVAFAAAPFQGAGS